MVRLYFQLYKGVQYVHVELCCLAPQRESGIIQQTKSNYELLVIRNVTGRQAECAVQGEKGIAIFSHLHSSLEHLSVRKLGDFWYVLALIRVKTFMSRPMPLLHFLLPS